MYFRMLIITLVALQFGFGQTKKVVTIFPFHFASTDLEEKEAIEELNGFFYDLFAGQLASTDYFEVVDRQNMKALMSEVALQQSGLTEQILELGKVTGAQLAIFGTVTRVFKQTFLTMKIIDIETSVILKAIKQKGSLKEPDELALEAGYKFMRGLSRILYQRYNIKAGNVASSSKDGLKDFLKGRDLIQQAIIAYDAGDEGKMKNLKEDGQKYLERAAEHEGLQPVVQKYREDVVSYLDY